MIACRGDEGEVGFLGISSVVYFIRKKVNFFFMGERVFKKPSSSSGKPAETLTMLWNS